MGIRVGVLVGICATFLVAVPALADNGPHGNFSPTTDGCAGCHRTHTASAPGLLIESAHNLCLTCHGASGGGADTNVMDGLYMDWDSVTEVPSEMGDGVSLKAGGFVNVTMDTDWDGFATPSVTTSKHTYDGATGTAWGNGAIGSGFGATGFSLTCTTCHDPHGGAGVDPVTGEREASYRILRDIPVGSGASALPPFTNPDPDISAISDETEKIYTLSNTIGTETVSGHETHGKNEYQYFGEPVTRYGLTDWCSQCHTRYMADAGTWGAPGGGSNDSGDPVYPYRHATFGVTNLGDMDCSICHFENTNEYNLLPATAHNIGCVTCHVAHGSSAHMAGYAASVEWPDGSAAPSGDERSSLLRMDNRGVCEMCHEKG